MFDVLVYLYETYYRPEACPDSDALVKKLSAVGFDEEMVMVAGIGVEIGPARRHDHFPQETGITELVQRVVDGGKRYRHAVRLRFGMKALRRDVPVFALEQHARERDPLPRGAKAGVPEAGGKIGPIA